MSMNNSLNTVDKLLNNAIGRNFHTFAMDNVLFNIVQTNGKHAFKPLRMFNDKVSKLKNFSINKV